MKFKILKGMTFIELMVAIAIGLIVLFALDKFYTDKYRQQKQSEEELFLQQNSQQLMNYLKHHIEHINYQGSFRENSNFNFFKLKQIDTEKTYSIVSNNCLLFFYDNNSDGCVGDRNKTLACTLGNINDTKDVAKEVFGFKTLNQSLYIYEDSNISECTLTNCEQLLTSCENGKWRKLTNTENFKITQLHFEWLDKDRVMKINLNLAKNKTHYDNIAYVYLLNSE